MAYRYNTNRLDVEFRNRLQGLNEDLTPQLGGSLDLNGHAFVALLIAGEALAADDVCYLNSSGKMVKADASADAQSRGMLSICTETLALDDVGTFVLKGFYTAAGLTAGGLLYLGTTTGTWSAAPPSGSGDILRVLGYAVTTTQMFFDPDKTWIELA